MSHGYRAVGWNRQKRRYDAVVWAGIALFIGTFVAVALLRRPPPTIETVLIRAFGSCALVLLHVVLSIGPLCRLDRRWLPLLYNRRHLGVSMFVVALAHGIIAFVQFHGLGALNPFVSVLASDGRWLAGGYPFQPLGVAALGVFFLMAATSHDFWLEVLTPPVWKSLHMAVYAAYALVVLHVALGLFQDAQSAVLIGLVGSGMAWLLVLHAAAAWRERRGDRPREAVADRDDDAYVDCGPAASIPDARARIVSLGGERVAVFRYGDRVSAISNVCRHQNGPLGEGQIVDGLVTCPWHGYQYRPADGCSPPPFEERVPTFRVRVVGGRVLVHPAALPPGTPVEPARIGEGVAADVEGGTARDGAAAGLTQPQPSMFDAFYVGYKPVSPPLVGRFVKPRVAALLAGTALVAAAVGAALPPNAASHFAFGHPRVYNGRLWLKPYPLLAGPIDEAADPAHDRRSGAPGDSMGYPILLVAPGKHGLDPAPLADLEGRWVTLTGTEARRAGRTMIEVVAGTIALRAADDPLPGGTGHADPPLAGARMAAAKRTDLVEIVGEITEAKCNLGVMNPGEGAVHRACASLCLRGGIPPIFVGRIQEGGEEAFLLVGPDGASVSAAAAEVAGQPLTIRAFIDRAGVWTVLWTDPASWRVAANGFGEAAIGRNTVCRIPPRPPPKRVPRHCRISGFPTLAAAPSVSSGGVLAQDAH